jgi:hypothetical protein
VAQGNHAVAVEGRAVSPARTDDLEIMHFPVRSHRHFENKIVLGGGAYGRNTELPPEAGKIWRDMYDIHQRGEFDEAYRRCVLGDEDVADGLTRGTLTTDTRLRDRLEDLMDRTLVGGAVSPNAPVPAAPRSMPRRRRTLRRRRR